jgi:hypothetical protein
MSFMHRTEKLNLLKSCGAQNIIANSLKEESGKKV